MQIINCPVCNGWSTNKLPIKGGFKTCEHCKGESIQIKEDQFVLFWDMPSYFDYGGRERAKITKIIIITSIFFVILLLIITLFVLGSQVTRLI